MRELKHIAVICGAVFALAGASLWIAIAMSDGQQTARERITSAMKEMNSEELEYVGGQLRDAQSELEETGKFDWNDIELPERFQ